MPSPLYLLSHETVRRNVPVGNESGSECITLTFKAIAPESVGSSRPYLTLEGGFDIEFHGYPVKEISASAGFTLGALYRLVPVES